MKKILKTKKIH